MVPSLSPYMQLLYNNTFHHFNPLFNKTTYQCVGPLPGHLRNKFVHIRIHTHTYIHTHTHTHMACQGFFHCILDVYLDIHKRAATAVVADELCLLLIKTVYMC